MLALQRLIANAYARAPEYDSSAVPAWQALAALCVQQSRGLRARFRIVEVDDPMPYPTAGAMFIALASGELNVSRANSAHPVWTVQENVAFRICHDIHGHYAAWRLGLVADFSWQGEYSAATQQERDLPPALVRSAFLTEALGQAAYALEFGEFGVHKVAFLD